MQTKNRAFCSLRTVKKENEGINYYIKIICPRLQVALFHSSGPTSSCVSFQASFLF